MEYRDGIRCKNKGRDTYVHVMQLDDGNCQASLACVLLPHNELILFQWLSMLPGKVLLRHTASVDIDVSTSFSCV